MADHDDGEDFFNDDDLDALPSDTLAELESEAIQFTQAQAQAQLQPHPSSDYGDKFEDDDLDDAVVIDESRSTPANVPALHRTPPGPPRAQERFRPQSYRTVGHPSQNSTNRQQQSYVVPPPPRFTQPSRSQARTPIPPNNAAAIGPPRQPINEDIAEKLRNYDELLKERNALRETVNAKSGEISIVRTKHEKTVKEYEREITALRKLNDDKLAKQQKALEAARIAEKSAATERDFIKQDLAEEAERVRKLAKARAAERKDGANLTATPKKKKSLPHRDGFDDDEIEILSPSKNSPSKFQRRNAISPTKPGKRKRKPVESPAGALQVVQPEEPPTAEPAGNEMVLDENVMAKLVIEDDRFDFLGTMLDHQIDSDHLRTIEEFGKHVLPSSSGESFQAILLGKIPSLGLKKSSRDLPIDFCGLLISMWANCVEKEFLTPIYLLIDMLSFALELKTSSIAPHIIDSLLPVTQLTADLVAIPRFNRNTTAPHDKHIDVSACMSILYLAALGCMSSQEHITRFWKLMRWDFVLMMLSTNQDKADYETMLHLLSTSVLRESVGTIPGDHTQHLQAGYILDRLTYPLNEVPFLPGSTIKCDRATISDLRLQILQLMTSMTRSPYASKAIAIHAHAIGRLACLMSDELDFLYDFKTGHQESARIISLSVRLLYHLVTKYDEIIDMQKKLSVIHGGSQKYLLCLSRLNFSEEDLLLESDIDPDVPAYALELLELIVTPEEGEAIQTAFSSQ